MFFVMVISVVLSFTFAGWLAAGCPMPKIKTKPKKVKEISDPSVVLETSISNSIYQEYNRLPADKRSMGDIAPVLRALEIQYGTNKVQQHFGPYSDISQCYYDYCLSNNYDKHGKRLDQCPYYKFTDLGKAIGSIKNQVKREKRNAQIAAVQGDLDNYGFVLDSLRREATLASEINDYMESRD